jgi:hypothetical protein
MKIESLEEAEHWTSLLAAGPLVGADAVEPEMAAAIAQASKIDDHTLIHFMYRQFADHELRLKQIERSLQVLAECVAFLVKRAKDEKQMPT